MQEVLAAGGEDERRVQGPGRPRRGGHALDGAVPLVDLIRIAVVVLDRAAGRAGLGRARDGPGGVLRRGAVAVLEVNGDRQRRGLVKRPDVLDDLVEGDAAVGPPQGEGEPAARRGQRLEAEAGEDLGRPGIPWVGDYERLRLMQSAK